MISVKHFFASSLLILIADMVFSQPPGSASRSERIDRLVSITDPGPYPGYRHPAQIIGNLIDGTISTVDLEATKHPDKTVVMFHSCNLQHFMGNAAGAVKIAMPAASVADNNTPLDDTRFLGGWSAAEMQTQKGNKFQVLNLYTQQHGGHVPNAQEHLDVIQNSLKNIVKQYPSDRYILVYPQFSSGVAGRDWQQDIEPMTNDILGKHIRHEISWNGSTSNIRKLEGRVLKGYRPSSPIVASLGRPAPAKIDHEKKSARIGTEKEPIERLTRKKQVGKTKTSAKTSLINEEVGGTGIEKGEIATKPEVEEVWYKTKTAQAAAAISGVAVVTAIIGYGISKFRKK